MNPFTILIVEDNAADSRLIEEVIRDWSVSCDLWKAADGDAALDILYQRNGYEGAPRPDLVLLDLVLPKLDGFDILATIKADPDLWDIPVVVLASQQAPDQVKRAYDLHANAFVRKPVTLDEYVRAITATSEYWLMVARLPREAANQ